MAWLVSPAAPSAQDGRHQLVARTLPTAAASPASAQTKTAAAAASAATGTTTHCDNTMSSFSCPFNTFPESNIQVARRTLDFKSQHLLTGCGLKVFRSIPRSLYNVNVLSAAVAVVSHSNITLNPEISNLEPQRMNSTRFLGVWHPLPDPKRPFCLPGSFRV